MMDFALKQLKNMGWTEGKGLGVEENGIIKPIAPNVQMDTRGLGFSVSDSLQLKNQWWTEAYNAASKGLKPEYKITTVGVLVKPKSKNKKKDDDYDNTVYNQHFVHAGTMGNDNSKNDDDITNKKDKKKRNKKKKDSGSLIQNPETNLEEEKDDQYSKKSLDFNNVFQKNGQKITCHKAARLGIKMSGKMKRIEEQEKEFILKTKKKLKHS